MGAYPMATAALEPTFACLTEWSDQRQRYEADLQESFDALDAFQRQLDAWQRRLADEQEQLDEQRARLKELADANGQADQSADQLKSENARLSEEAEQARQGQQDLQRQLEEARAELAREKQHWSGELERVAKLLEQQSAAPADAPAAAGPGPAVSGDPVLGSVVAQFSKLRQQRAERGHR
ncbi:Chromosome partition protein Smc [Posidoniimonas corsicana]|uniref:Chromosome partition protein Smc n=2 Tax=Posidoniimonas corsicana TaxID=1938618 RepID=A0A5C5VJV6_9BACT|nr:Chromosome partition protein Smc [Posidoniimonas corsicana]